MALKFLLQYLSNLNLISSSFLPAGRVVGKKGVVIANIQRETQLRLMNALQPVGSSSWVSVVMIGEALKVQVAYNAVADIVQNGTELS